MLNTKKTKTQRDIEMKPLCTDGSEKPQPRCNIERRHSVGLVNGKNRVMNCNAGYMPSIGQMIPHNITIGKKEPNAT